MSPAIWSLIALIVAIVASVASRVNVGILAIALAWVVGVFIAGQKPETLIQGFPASLFLTLAGVTLLFGLAQANGTLGRLTGSALQLTRGATRWLPLSFFLVAGLVSTVGPGAVASVALVAPIAMAVGLSAGVPPFLTALMVANGANAGALSAISSVGIIANTKMAEAGLGGHEVKVWFANFAAHVLVGGAAYFALGGHRLPNRPVQPTHPATEPMSPAQWTAAGVIAIWIVGVAFFKFPVGLSAFGAAAVIILLRSADEVAAIRLIPLGVILMVSGVSVLIAMLEKTGGMELFTTMLARLATGPTVNGVIAFVTGAISTYSSTSGVVLPAFLPTSADIVAKVGGGDPLAVALSINVGSSLVDVSPLSTLGAICVATLTDPAAARRLFRQLLGWGLSMTVVGALLCQLFAGLIARW